MYWNSSVLAVMALLCHALAMPNAPEMEKRVIIASTSCSHDNLYRSFIDPRTSLSASFFCSTYIRSTATIPATKTVTTTTTVTAAVKRDVEEKRDLAATTYPPARLSSACSCILTGQPVHTTSVYATTATATVTQTGLPYGCTLPPNPLLNGDFEHGLAPWIVNYVYPSDAAHAKAISYGVESPGYNSAKAFTVHDNKAGSFFELELGQTVQLCYGQRYNVNAQFYMTDTHDRPTKQTQVDLVVDLEVMASSSFSQAQGPPVVWYPLTASFMPGIRPTRLAFDFIATDTVNVTWGLDDVVITPA